MGALGGAQLGGSLQKQFAGDGMRQGYLSGNSTDPFANKDAGNFNYFANNYNSENYG